jgi:nitrogen regulatory protein P-II 1
VRLVTAVIRPHKLDDVRDALNVFGVRGMTVSQVMGFGMEMWRSQRYRGVRQVSDLLPNLRIDVLAPDDDAEDVVGVIIHAARTGGSGDGKIWSVPVDAVVRVRTGERGVDAL